MGSFGRIGFLKSDSVLVVDTKVRSYAALRLLLAIFG